MRRRSTLALVGLLVVGACSGSKSAPTTSAANGPSTTTAGSATTTTEAPPRIPEMPVYADGDEVVAIDPEVVTGTLPNGMTYYIRENSAPGGRAQLRLAVKAGSLQEAADQRGAAHYLEHMMFNGTDRFPANELVLVLQRFGAEFGADINAYTSYEETVYQLELPTDDPATVAAGFDVLFEWATAASIDPAEVDLERGVLVEEWRLRDQGFWGRYFTGVRERLLGDTAYAGKQPLGTPAEVAATTPEGLRSFYERWYRTDTMAVVAVGDFDAAVVERLIRERFGAILPHPDPEPVPVPTTSPASAPTFLVLADPETAEAWVELNYPLPAADGGNTVGGVRRALAFDLGWDMVVTRLQEASLRGEVPFWNPSFAANPLVRGQRSPGVAAYTHPEELAVTTEALLAAVAQAVTHGFTPSEMDRAVTEIRAAIQLAFDERGTTQDRSYADDYVEHYLGSAPIPSAQDWYDLRSDIVDELTADEVWNVFAATLVTTQPFVIVVTPELRAADAPGIADLEEIVERVAVTDHAPWVDESTRLDTLMTRPDPVRITSRGPFSGTGITEIVLANGARVVLLPTSIRDDVVVFGAASPGGWSLLPARDVAEAQMIAAIVTDSGVGDIDQVTLDRSLAGLSVALTPYIDETEEGFFGEAATRDLETLLQLVHLYMTAPRAGEVARDIAIAETLPFARDPGQLPDLAVAAALAEERFSDDARFAVVPPEAELLDLDLDRALEIFRDRFDDPGDFVFVFSGDFEQDEVEDLARSYLGTIPGPGDLETWADVRPDPPAAVVDRTVRSGSGELGGITLLFSTLGPLDFDTRITVDLLELVLQQRLTERIREQLSASYSPSTRAELVEAPVQGVEFRIQVSADPADLDEVTAQTLAVLASLRATGPTADEMAIASEQLLREYELVSNEQLARAIIFSALHPDEPLGDVITRIDATYDYGIAQVRDLARRLLPGDRYIEIRLVPVG